MKFSNRRTALLTGSLLSVSLLVVGCSSGGTDAGGGSDTAGGSELCPDGSIHIGIAKAQTGGFAVFDQVGGNGSLIAIDQINEDGGVAGCQLAVEWKDIKSDPAVGQQVTAELIAEGAQIIIAPSDFDLGVPASLAAAAEEVFTISPEASSTDWPKAAGPHMFVQAITEYDLGGAQAIFANEQGWETGFVVINDAFNFFNTTRDIFEESFDGEILDSVAVADDATDYSAVISKIRAASPQPDFIYLADYYPHVGTFLKQMNAGGVSLPVLGNPTFSSPELPAAVGDNATLANVFFPSQSYFEGPGAAPEIEDFIARYEDKFGEFPPNANALAGYEGVLLLAKALESAQSTDADKLAEAMSALTDVELPGSTVFKITDGYTVRSATVVGFTDEGEYREVERVNPSEAG